MGIWKKVYSVRLSEEEGEKLKEYAEAENRSVSNYLETLVKEHIKQKEVSKDA